MGVGASESILIDATVNSNVASGATLTNNAAVTTSTPQAQAAGCPKPVGSASFNTRVNVAGATLVPSMQTAGMMDLVITDGPASRNTIMVLPSGWNDTVLVDGRMMGTFACTGRIVVYGDDNDYEWISPAISKSAWLYGGNGTNYLCGGGGNDVIVGGPGTNYISGGSGRNLLIGGGGNGSPNYILGTTGDNIEISGTTCYDANQAALCAILKEWDGGDSYSVRVQKITQTGLNVNGSTVVLNSSTIQRAAAREYLFGGSGQNLYFANETGSFFDRDYVIGRKSFGPKAEIELPN
jgi:Ca2+-binding RTX toxin-like protein